MTSGTSSIYLFTNPPYRQLQTHQHQSLPLLRLLLLLLSLLLLLVHLEKLYLFLANALTINNMATVAKIVLKRRMLYSYQLLLSIRKLHILTMQGIAMKSHTPLQIETTEFKANFNKRPENGLIGSVQNPIPIQIPGSILMLTTPITYVGNPPYFCQFLFLIQFFRCFELK